MTFLMTEATLPHRIQDEEVFVLLDLEKAESLLNLRADYPALLKQAQDYSENSVLYTDLERISDEAEDEEQEVAAFKEVAEGIVREFVRYAQFVDEETTTRLYNNKPLLFSGGLWYGDGDPTDAYTIINQVVFGLNDLFTQPITDDEMQAIGLVVDGASDAWLSFGKPTA